MNSSLPAWFPGVLLSLQLIVGYTQAQTARTLTLFDASSPEPFVTLAETMDPGWLRSRTVEVYSDRPDPSRLTPGTLVRLPLFADREYVGRITEVVGLADSVVSWRGTLEGYVNGHFSAVTTVGGTSFHLSDGRGGDFDVRPEAGGAHRLCQARSGELGNCGTCGVTPTRAIAPSALVAPALPPPLPPPPKPSADITYIDVLVLYTPNARAAAGGPDAIQSKAYHFIVDSNWRHRRSNTHVQLRLVGWQEIAYDDSSQDLGRHLANMASDRYPAESIQAEVASRREAAGADFVVLLTHGRANSGSVLGIAAGWPSVVEWTQDTAVFTHELGHSMGCHHEINAPDHPPTGNYNLGYGHTEEWDLGVGKVTEKRVTIMYSGFNPDTRTDYFSNPDISFLYTGNNCGGFGDGACLDVTHPLGVANSVDNARYLRENRATSAQLKQPKFYLVREAPGGDGSNLAPANNLSSVYSQWFPATEAVPGAPTIIRVAEGHYPAPIRITQNSRLEKWLGAGPVRLGP